MEMREKTTSFSSRSNNGTSPLADSINVEAMGREAQQVVDQLFDQGRLGASLTVRRVVSEGSFVAAHFAEDSLPVIALRRRKNESFKDQFKAAVLERVPPPRLRRK
jgi:hypothetical protein